QIFLNMIPFAVEMAYSGPEYEAAKETTKAATAKLGARWFKETVDEVLKRRAVRAVSEGVGIVAGGVRRMATPTMAPSFVGATARQYQDALPLRAELPPEQKKAADAAQAALDPLTKQYEPLRAQYDALWAQSQDPMRQLAAEKAQLDAARAQVN